MHERGQIRGQPDPIILSECGSDAAVRYPSSSWTAGPSGAAVPDARPHREPCKEEAGDIVSPSRRGGQPQTASKYGIRSIPNLLVFKNGQKVGPSGRHAEDKPSTGSTPSGRESPSEPLSAVLEDRDRAMTDEFTSTWSGTSRSLLSRCAGKRSRQPSSEELLRVFGAPAESMKAFRPFRASPSRVN